ncbi:MAG TPA: MFS transporter [Gemmataceae bacterium]|jgi:MFS family permease|nr:MFS transporter [Gemmataceae bacterium]
MDDSHPPQVQDPAIPTPVSAAPAIEAGTAPSGRSALLIVFLVVFIDLLGFGIVLPLLPLYADDLLEPLFPGERRAALRGVLLGLLMSSFSAMQFFFAPLWGRVSDRIGRRPILLLGLGGSVVFYSLFGVASDLGAAGHLALAVVLLFVARLGAGVAGATISTAQAVIADTTTPERRARGMALIGAAFGIGFTFGPLLGFASLFVDVAGAPGYMAAALSLVAFVLAMALLPETVRAGGSAHLRRRLLDWGGLQRVLRTPSVGILVVTFFLATFAFGGLESTLALGNRLLLTGEELTREARQRLLTKEAARTTERSNFLVFAYVGFVLMLIQGLVYRRLVARVGEVRFLRAGVVLMALGLFGAVAVLAVRQDVASRGMLLGCALLVMTVAVIGFAFLTPSVQSLVSRRSDPLRQGEVLGVNQSGAALARILGPLVGLSLFDLPHTSHILPYACGAAVLIVVCVLSLRIHQD